jgi:hypothetical protein
MSAVQAVLNLLHSVATWQSAANGNKSFQVKLFACGDHVASDLHMDLLSEKLQCSLMRPCMALIIASQSALTVSLILCLPHWRRTCSTHGYPQPY